MNNRDLFIKYRDGIIQYGLNGSGKLQVLENSLIVWNKSRTRKFYLIRKIDGINEEVFLADRYCQEFYRYNNYIYGLFHINRLVFIPINRWYFKCEALACPENYFIIEWVNPNIYASIQDVPEKILPFVNKNKHFSSVSTAGHYLFKNKNKNEYIYIIRDKYGNFEEYFFDSETNLIEAHKFVQVEKMLLK